MLSVRMPWIAAFFGLMLVACVQPAWAQENKDSIQGINYGVVDLERIRREATMFRNLTEKLNAYVTKVRAEEKAERGEIDAASQEFSRKRAILAPEAYAEERKKFEVRVAEFQKRARSRQEAVNRIQTQGLVQAQKEVEGALVAYAKQTRTAMIFRSDMLAFYHPALDITEIVVKELNAKVPQIEVPALEK